MASPASGRQVPTVGGRRRGRNESGDSVVAQSHGGRELSRDVGDTAFLAPLTGLLERDGRFGHRQHVELAWRYLQCGDSRHAEQSMRQAIRHVADSHGSPDRYHETLTTFWTRVVALHASINAHDTFDAFADEHPRLLDKDLPARHYTASTLWSGQARIQWVEPDLVALPAPS